MGTAVKVPARDFPLYVNTGTYEAPDWVEIGGLESLNFTKSPTNADTTTRDTNGYKTSLKTLDELAVSASGFMMIDPDDGTRDEGQEFVEGLDRQFGSDNVGEFKIDLPSGTPMVTFYASVSIDSMAGGGVGDAADWKVTLTNNGDIVWGSGS